MPRSTAAGSTQRIEYMWSTRDSSILPGPRAECPAGCSRPGTPPGRPAALSQRPITGPCRAPPPPPHLSRRPAAPETPSPRRPPPPAAWAAPPPGAGRAGECGAGRAARGRGARGCRGPPTLRSSEAFTPHDPRPSPKAPVGGGAPRQQHAA